MGAIIALVLIVLGIFLLINIVGFGVNLVIAILTWFIAGAIASRLVGGDGQGFLTNTLVGAVGGIIGGLVLNLLNIPLGDVWLVGNILVGIVGAVILIFIVRAVSGNKAFGL